MAGVFVHAYSLIRDRRFGASCGLSLVLHRSSDHGGEPEYSLGQSLEFSTLFYALFAHSETVVLVCADSISAGCFFNIRLDITAGISFRSVAHSCDVAIFGVSCASSLCPNSESGGSIVCH